MPNFSGPESEEKFKEELLDFIQKSVSEQKTEIDLLRQEILSKPKFTVQDFCSVSRNISILVTEILKFNKLFQNYFNSDLFQKETKMKMEGFEIVSKFMYEYTQKLINK